MGILKSFRKFLGFLGLDISDGPQQIVKKSSEFKDRKNVCWIGTTNHNWLRISRILQCLRLIGRDAEAAAFMAFLETLPQDGIQCGSSLRIWRARAATNAAF